ncbi:hypothetical protein Hdeb2414_s0009g00319471 [Helianthus debilis subsp. tardiflorus]
MSSKREMLKQEFQGFRYSYGESIEALTSRFAELLSEMEKAEMVVSTRTSNSKLLDVLKRIPDQANYSWFINVNQIIVTTDCYYYKMKTDKLISLIKSYDNAEKQKAQCNTSDAVCSPTPTSTAPLPAAVGSSTSDAGIQIHDFTPIPNEVYKVIIEDWVEGDDVVCQRADDGCPKTSNLSADALPYVRKDASELALRGPSNKYVPPKPTVKNKNAKSSECTNCCKQRQMKQGKKAEKAANKSSNKSYNSYSASVGWNGSGYAPYVKKQTCYNCGIPGTTKEELLTILGC